VTAVLQTIKTVKQPVDAGSLFTDATAAEYIGDITPRAVRRWRTHCGLPFIRITAKVCRIRREDLDRWLAERRVAITRGIQ
jgi:hypothetical protein